LCLSKVLTVVHTLQADITNVFNSAFTTTESILSFPIDVTIEFTSISTKAELVRAILTERRIELLAEGFRANDVARPGESINSFRAGAIITPSDPRYIFGIPLIETQTNPSIGK
jgi:hypothetical protein